MDPIPGGNNVPLSFRSHRERPSARGLQWNNVYEGLRVEAWADATKDWTKTKKRKSAGKRCKIATPFACHGARATSRIVHSFEEPAHDSEGVAAPLDELLPGLTRQSMMNRNSEISTVCAWRISSWMRGSSPRMTLSVWYHLSVRHGRAFPGHPCLALLNNQGRGCPA
jgi:hypothetical protein